MVKEPKLTTKQQMFVNEYLIDLNGTQAAIRAGYSEKTAQVISAENLTKPMIASAIQEAIDKRTEKTGLTAEKVIADLQLLRDMCMGLVPVTQTVMLRDSEGSTLPTEITQKVFEPASAKGALELLGKHLKLFTEKTEITGKDGAPIQQEVSITESRLSKVRAITAKKVNATVLLESK